MLLLLLACSTAAEDACDLDTTATELAGDGATACGAAGSEPDEADWTCAIDAWTAGTPFVLRYTLSGVDSIVERAIVYDGARVWILSQDQYGDGPWDIDGTECVDPYVLSDGEDPYDVLDCGSTEPEGNHYQVCGDICEDCGDPDPLPFDP